VGRGVTVIPDTLLINGTDIVTITGIYVTKFDGFHKDGPYRGENLTIPGMPGQVSFAKVRDAYVMDLGLAVTGDTRLEFVTGLAALRTLIGSDNLCTLTRRFSSGAGPGYTDLSCEAEYLGGADVELVVAEVGRTTVSFLNLDGGWA
jgi:hypothetical protein